jgi:hypothetical protein
MSSPDFQLRRASHADLDAFYRLFAQVQSIHADAEPDFFCPPEKDEIFKQYFEGILGDPSQHLLFACLDFPGPSPPERLSDGTSGLLH